MELGQVIEGESFSMGSCLLQTYLFEKLVTKIEGSENYIHQNGKFKLPGVITTEALPEASALSVKHLKPF